MRPVAAFFAVSLLMIAACGGGQGPTATPAGVSTNAPTHTVPTAPPGGSDAAALCVLTPEDWQQFNYVTGATPDVISDEPGTAICQYASALFLEMYTHDNETDADATYQTMLENIPVDDPQELTLPRADVVTFDPDIGDNHAGIVVRAGRLDFLITGLARDSVQAELMTLAGLVLARTAALQ
jgi:hypothetical protein